MANEWIIDVLSDLEAFASKNGLPALERQLGITRETALREVGSMDAGLCQGMAGNGIDDFGGLHRGNANGPVA